MKLALISNFYEINNLLGSIGKVTTHGQFLVFRTDIGATNERSNGKGCPVCESVGIIGTFNNSALPPMLTIYRS
jgi:hypothetical protein